MTVVALVFAAFFPLILWSFFAVRSRYVSIVCLLLSVLTSLTAIAAASLAQVLLNPASALISGMGHILFSSFIESALIEECAKFALLYWLVASPLVYRLCKDGQYCGAHYCKAEYRWILSCALTLGLGFSAFETVAYAIMNPDIVWFRSLTALLVHGSTALVAGALVAVGGRRADIGAGDLDPNDGGLAGDDSPKLAFVPALVLFAVAVALHGAYNACLLTVGFVPAAFIVLLLLGFAVHVWGKADVS